MASTIADISKKTNGISDGSKKLKPDYLILSGGVIGFAVAKQLSRNTNREIAIIDIDPIRVETLRQAGFNAIFGDCTSAEVFNQIDTKNIICVAALNSNNDVNMISVENFRTHVGPDVTIVSRVSDELKIDDIFNVGADHVFVLPRMISGSIVEYMEKTETKHMSNRLAACFEDNKGKTLGIIVHDNPDPDAISSGFALKEIASKFGIEAEILYDGKIGHQENKAFVNLLDLHMKKITSVDDYYAYDKLAMVDCSKPQVNNSVPLDVELMVVIDHHPTGGPEKAADLVDIRTNVGASATIMTRYLQQLDVPISKELATALLFGIRTDTNNFRRNTTSEDFAAASYLHPLSDHDLLTQVETTTVSVETLDILGEAIRNRDVIATTLMSNVGFIRDKDTLPQAADYLLTMDGISTTLIYGVLDDNIAVSARNDDIRVHIGDVMKQAFGDNAGGHATMAGALIPLGVFSAVKDRDTLLQLVGESVSKRFMAAMGLESEKEE